MTKVKSREDLSRATARRAWRADIDFRLLFENAPGLFLVLRPDSPDFTILGASNAYLAATMTEREKIVGRGLFEVFPDNPADVQATGTSNLRASLGRALANRAPDTMAVQKYDIRRPESEGGGFEERFWSPVNSPVLTGTGQVGYILHRVEDVTEYVRASVEQREKMKGMELEILSRSRELDEARLKLSKKIELSERDLKETEAKLLHAQKLEAVGRLAGGVAHDFNNLLSVIIGYAQFANEGLPKGSKLREDIDEIQSAGERAAELTRQLLAFSRKQVMQPVVLDINEAVTRMDKMLRRLLGEDVTLQTKLGRNIGRTRADPGQLEQIIVNLAVNARDAMPQGGNLLIETSATELDQSFTSQHSGVSPGPHVCIAISDTGMGMDAATRERIFEPFFTTKELGKGTGLGLSTVYGIVKQSGGAIWVYSELGKGTTFKIYLPATREAVTSPKRPTKSLGTRGTETILVVEDEGGVGRLVRQVLEGAGYSVLIAGNGEAAISTYDKHPETRLLLTDVVLPGMGGPQIAQALQGKGAGLKLLFMSGYSDDALGAHGILEAGVNFIEKPLRPDTLLAKVREVLDG